mmetsp:Transcript_31374/g.89002  ORF Transcript_31374/g.89002 Transcript_31374/m.89002 type:complete len:283 (+) Transcript_31374:585-1433(+)
MVHRREAPPAGHGGEGGHVCQRPLVAVRGERKDEHLWAGGPHAVPGNLPCRVAWVLEHVLPSGKVNELWEPETANTKARRQPSEERHTRARRGRRLQDLGSYAAEPGSQAVHKGGSSLRDARRNSHLGYGLEDLCNGARPKDKGGGACPSLTVIAERLLTRVQASARAAGLRDGQHGAAVPLGSWVCAVRLMGQQQLRGLPPQELFVYLEVGSLRGELPPCARGAHEVGSRLIDLVVDGNGIAPSLRWKVTHVADAYEAVLQAEGKHNLRATRQQRCYCRLP